MRIAILSFRLPAPGLKRGGGERVAHDLAEGLTRRGHWVTVWSADPRPPAAAYTVARMPGARLIRHWLGFRLVSGYLGNLLALLPRYDGADVLIANGDSVLLPLRPLLGRGRLPVLRIMHGSALDEARTARSLPRKLLQTGVWLQERLTVAIQPTVGISRNTQQRYPRIRQVIPNGVDTTRFYPARHKTVAPSILFVGTLGGRKRGTLLMRWFAEIIQPAVPDAVLWMVTEPGPPMPGVRYFIGASETLLAELYRTAWVFASPSVYEGFGLPYLEAMASGTPVVATRNPGSAEILENGESPDLERFGRLEDDDAFAPAVIALLRDPAERQWWTARGRERSQAFSLERTVTQYEAALRELATATAPAARAASA